MATPRLPIPGSDDGTWGDLLNAFLGVSHNTDGSLKPSAVSAAGGGANVDDGSITTAKLADNAVTNAKLDGPTQAAIAAVASKYVKPGGGIPATDLDAATQANLLKASTSVQTVNTKAPVGGNVSIGLADLTDVSNAAAATDGQVLTFSGSSSKWGPATVSTSGTIPDADSGTKGILKLAGDLGGTADAPSVVKVNGVAVTGTPSANQVLTASSSTAASWGTPTSGLADPTTTKGDLIVHGTSTTTRLAVGTDGQVLTADSTQAAGTKWATPTGSGSDNTKLAIANNLSDLASPSTARTNLGLGTAATISSTAGGDLTGTLPNPTVAKVNGVAVSGTPSTGQTLVATGTTAASWQTVAGAGSLTATPVQTGGANAYTANPNELVPVDASSGAYTVTLPTAPANGTRQVIKKVDSSVNQVTIQAGGTDAFETTSGSQTLSLTLLNQSTVMQYYATDSVWIVTAGDLPISPLRDYFAGIFTPLFGSVNVVSSAGTTQTIPSPAVYTENILTLTAASCALTLPTGLAGSASVVILLQQDNTGGRDYTVTNSNLVWQGGVKPAVDGTANSVSWFVFYTKDGGTNWIGSGPASNSFVRYDINTQGLATNLQQNARINMGAAHRLSPTGVKTGAYTANLGDLVEVNATSAAVTITAPATGAPAGARFGIKKYDTSANAVTLTAQGSDSFITGASGSSYTTAASVTLTIQETRVWVSDGSGHWTVEGGNIPKSQLDTLYTGGGGGAARTAAWLPSDNQLAGVSDNPAMFTGGNATPVASTTYTYRIFVKASVAITKLSFDITVVGAGGAGYYVALYDVSGNLIATTGSADFSASLTATGVVNVSFGASYTPSADGFIYVAFRTGTATTQPKVVSAGSPALANLGLSTVSIVAGPTAPRYGVAANAWSGATPPATLGAINPSGGLVTFIGVA